MNTKMNIMTGFKVLLEQTLIPFIAKEHGIDEGELCNTLIKFFSDNDVEVEVNPKRNLVKKKKSVPIIEEEEDEEDDLSEEEKTKKYLSMTLTDLKALLKSKGKTRSGTKAKLVNRLLGRDENIPITVVAPKKPKAAAVKKPKKDVLPKVLPVVEPQEFELEKNSYGNWIIEISGSTLVMKSEESDEVVGIQHEDGEVLPLDSSALEICKQYNFNYIMPEFVAIPTDIDEEVDEED